MDAIAIIGLAGRFPGARDIEQLWSNLAQGVESISFFTDEELRAAGVSAATLADPSYVKAKAILEDFDKFDARFFGYTPREAELIDPQQRVFLEAAWAALEHSGYEPSGSQVPVGVYAGLSLPSYLLLNLLSHPDLLASVGETQVELSNDKDYLATRVSYKLNLKGPSLNIQTACSTSLVAVHLACRALLGFECDMALAGGVAVRVPQSQGYQYQQGGVLSPDGHCRAFDAEAKGIVPGSGVGVVVLKRLEDALADRDTIHAVIKGTAINNDGSRKVGYTAAGVDGQAEVIAAAQAVAEVEPRSISYIEAHGTGTLMGDPIEIAALTQAFRAGTADKGFCAIGSVKTNLGHLDSAAGITGLIKTTLALTHEQLPPSLHFTAPNPAISFETSPFFVNAALRPWPRGKTPRRAGVSSFGIGGTNAHVVLEEAPAREPVKEDKGWQLVTISARTAIALEQATDALAAHLVRGEASLADAAFTLQRGRRAFEHRRAIVCRDGVEAGRALAAREGLSSVDAVQAPSVVFMFPGQGAQHVGMARALYAADPGFREDVDHCARVLEPLLGRDLRALLFATGTAAKDAGALLTQTRWTQPALFVVEYALARLWIRLGISPAAMIGHSLGEYVAACLAGVFSLEDALGLVAARGALMQALPAGAMLAVAMPEAEVLALLGPDLVLAAVNGPSQCVVSGTLAAVEALEGQLSARQLTGKRLRTSHAFHSPMMDPILEVFAHRVGQVTLRAPTLPILSNLTGTWLTAEQATDPRYWARQLRAPVRFADGLKTALSSTERVLLEVGPGRALATFARLQRTEQRGQHVYGSLPHGEEDDQRHFLEALALVWLAGAKPDWAALHSAGARGRVPLPTYPFARERYFIEPAAATAARPVSEERAQGALAQPEICLPSWTRLADARLSPKRIDPVARTWMLLLDGSPLGEKVALGLEANGQTVVRAQASGSDRVRGAVAQLVARTAGPCTLVHFWALKPDASAEVSRGFFELLELGKAIAARKSRDPVELVIVTTELQSVCGEDTEGPERAALLGACRVLQAELPGVSCRAVDLEAGDAAALLVEELGVQGEDVVALRGGRRWVQTLAPVQLPVQSQPLGGLREGGTYLITGGLGGIGGAVAERFAQVAKANLALVSRSSPTAEQLRNIEKLEQLGARVVTFSADVADSAAMREVVDQVRAQFGTLNGVVHAAGISSGALLELKTPASAAEVLRPKLEGTIALAAALGRPLDFFVLCSSLSAILGDPGQVDYAAANAFLDAFAQSHGAISINWDAWEEVGMAAKSRLPAAVGRAVNHPLLDVCLTDTDASVEYRTDFRVERQWVLNEHRILGGAVVPGTTYLEMVRAAFVERGATGTVELRDIVFVRPMQISDHETREVRTAIANGAFVVRSRGRVDEPWQDHVRGNVGLASSPVRCLAVAEVQQRCEAQSSEVVLGLLETQKHMVYGQRWKTLKQVAVGKGERIAELELDLGFEGDLPTLALHPSLLDVATALAMPQVTDGFYLPITYGALRVHHPMERRVFSHIRYHGAEAKNSSTLVCDVVIANPSGVELVVISDFTMIKVDAAQVFAAQPVASLPTGLKTSQALDALMQILASKPGPQVVVAARPLAVLRAEVAQLAQALTTPRSPDASPALKAHARPRMKSAYVAPTDETEAKVAVVWQEMLGVSEIGINDDFFELGGHSLLSIQLISKLRGMFGLELPLSRFFEAPTVAGVAQIIKVERSSAAEQLEIEKLLAEVEQMSAEEMQQAMGDTNSALAQESAK